MSIHGVRLAPRPINCFHEVSDLHVGIESTGMFGVGRWDQERETRRPVLDMCDFLVNRISGGTYYTNYIV